MIKIGCTEIEVEIMGKDIVVHVSNYVGVLSIALPPEKARELSAELFSKYVESVGAGKLPS